MTGYSMLLPGIDGANPLGFLAALGTLRTLARAAPNLNPRMSWRVDTGAWRPELRTEIEVSKDELVERLDAALKAMVDHPAWALGDNLNVQAHVYRQYALEAASAFDEGKTVHAEFAAAFACDSVTETDAKKRTVVSDTAFRTMSGAGHQNFLGFMRNLASSTSNLHLDKALFELWRYDDPVENMTMRWDPRDDVRHALRWRKPSGDPERKKAGSMWGANRLAIEALPLLPVMPRGSRLETTGFVTAGSRGTWFTWPIWRCPIPVPVVRSLLADRRLREVPKHREALAQIGVATAFRSQRLTVDKYRNFTMGVPV